MSLNQQLIDLINLDVHRTLFNHHDFIKKEVCFMNIFLFETLE